MMSSCFRFLRPVFATLSLLVLLLFATQALQAQSLSDIDFRNINVNQLSDAQLQQANQEIQDRGLSMEQVEQLAISRGAQPAQARQLVSRLRQIQMMGTGEDSQSLQRERPTGETRFVGDLDGDRMFEALPDSTTPDSLKIFGMELFGRVSTSFEPSFNVPTPQDYRVGPGDQLVINVWGAAEQNYQLLVDAEGTIRVDNVGPIQVSGMTIEEANQKIIDRLSDIYSGLRPNTPSEANTWARVSLGNIRSIRVTVTGEVQQPGSYTVSSLSTLFNALYAAGGPNRNGTFRQIRVLRRGEPVHTFDMYDFLIDGDQSDNIRLRDEDIIQVGPYENRVHAWGETKRVGFFEMVEGETLSDLIEYVAGFTDEAYTRTLTLNGMTPTMRRINTVLWPEGGEAEIHNGDRLQVGRLLERYANRVSIAGAVFRAGDYELAPGMTLYDLINEADGLREDASLQRGVIERFNDRLEPRLISFNVERVLEDPATYDIELQRDDLVRISSIFDLREEYTVRVSGAVNAPQQFEFRNGMTIEDIIFRADGFRDSAAPYRIEVARRVTGNDDPNQLKMDRIAERIEFQVDENLTFEGDEGSFELRPFDQVYVRSQPNYQEQRTVIITGEVQYPGEYVISSRDARLSDLIQWAGGLSDYAYPEGASLDRILEITNETQVTELEGQAIAGVGNNQGGNAGETQRLRESLGRGELTSVQDTVNTPVGIQMAEALGAPRSGYDLILEPGDVIHVPKELQTVRVEGEVLAPTSVRYDPSRSFGDYLSMAGGITEDARRRRAYIVYANGEVDRTKSFLFIRNNPSVEPGATIIVPEKPIIRTLTPQERISLASSIASTAILFITLLDRL
ncbi:MAG: SLBB domain-containing protein [Balneolaceae bacterium]